MCQLTQCNVHSHTEQEKYVAPVNTEEFNREILFTDHTNRLAPAFRTMFVKLLPFESYLAFLSGATF
jgi:hypothetical protein